MDKFERHLIKPTEVKIVNESGEEDVFNLVPLPFSHLGDFFDCLGTLSKMGDVADKGLSEADQVKSLLSLLDKATVNIVKGLVLSTFQESYPDQNKATLEKFCSQHFMELFPIVIEINTKTMSSANAKGKISKAQR